MSSKNTMQAVQSIINKTLAHTVNSKQLSKNNILLHDLFQDETKYVKKYEVFESTEDLLVLSCAWYRCRNSNQDSHGTLISTHINGLTDNNLYENLKDEDYVLAKNIRDYYSKKIMILKLKNNELTKFREDLNQFIHNDGKIFKQDVMGMVYRLPEFYEYDSIIDRIFTDKSRNLTKVNATSFRETKTLKLVDCTINNKRGQKSIEYWFTDNDNHIVTVVLDSNNPLINIWEKLISDSIKLNGIFFIKKKDEYVYYQAEKYSLEA